MVNAYESLLGPFLILISFTLPFILNEITKMTCKSEEVSDEVDEVVRENEEDESNDLQDASEFEDLTQLEEITEFEEVTDIEELPQEQPSHTESPEPDLGEPNNSSYMTDYNHPLWPSPRPVNFVKYLKVHHPFAIQYEGRLTHGRAIEILASRAGISIEEFMEMDPIKYVNEYMPATNARSLLKNAFIDVERYLYQQRYLLNLRNEVQNLNRMNQLY